MEFLIFDIVSNLELRYSDFKMMGLELTEVRIMTESRRSYCGLCHPRCGLLLEIDGGRIDRRMADADHGWWFPERREAGPELFGVFESNAECPLPGRGGVLQSGDRQLAPYGSALSR